jgi:hypothetical protein
MSIPAEMQMAKYAKVIALAGVLASLVAMPAAQAPPKGRSAATNPSECSLRSEPSHLLEPVQHQLELTWR